jgi:hypothetical protein
MVCLRVEILILWCEPQSSVACDVLVWHSSGMALAPDAAREYVRLASTVSTGPTGPSVLLPHGSPSSMTKCPSIASCAYCLHSQRVVCNDQWSLSTDVLSSNARGKAPDAMAHRSLRVCFTCQLCAGAA